MVRRVAGLVIGAGLVVALWLGLLSYHRRQAAGPPGTHTTSSQFATQAEKIAFLKKYLAMASPVDAVEFYVFYRKPEGDAAPERDIKAVMKMAPEHLPLWTKGMQEGPLGATDVSWAMNLMPADPRQGWIIRSRGTYYRHPDEGRFAGVFEKEGILILRLTSY